ncbi:ankyrin repeat domain-containing protein [Lysinibacillus sphaericus]|uniref:ankyrin repeat domain-containing protein n=1 Tax=Lysinibacillus sphaericus TaxID=1421 RepID=UPI003D74BEAF
MQSMFSLIRKKDNVAFLTALINKGTNVNGLNGQGQSPLYVAIVNGDKKIVEELIKNKVNIDSVNSNGESAQTVAEKYNKSLVELFEQGKFVIKYDKQKNVYMVSGITLGNSRKDVVNKLGNPAKRQEFTSINGEIDCNFYYLKDSTGKNIETQYCTYTGSNKIEEITFDFYPKHLNENWYKDLGKPFVMDDGNALFYLEGTEQILNLKPNEELGFLTYADANFYYYYPKD